MKNFIASAVIAFAGLFGMSAAEAAGNFTFSPATDGTYICNNGCKGFVTSDPAHTVASVNVTYTGGYAVNMQVDGKDYYGVSPTSTISSLTLMNREFNAATQSFTSDGTYIIASVQYTTAFLGCGRNCHRTVYFPNTGAVTLP